MTTLRFANNATTTLAGAINSTATTANLAAGSGALFPSLGAGEIFKMTFNDAATGVLTEIVNVTAISGDVITMVRGQEGTDALNWNAGDLASNLVTAGTMDSFAQGGLSGYVTNASLTATLASYVTTAALAADLASYVTSSSLATTLSGYVTNGTLATDLALYPLLTAFTQNLSGSNLTKEFPPLGGVNYTIKTGIVTSTTGNGDAFSYDSPFPTSNFAIWCTEGAASGWAGNPTAVGGTANGLGGFRLYTMKFTGPGWIYDPGITANYLAIGW